MEYAFTTEKEIRNAFWQGNLKKHIKLYNHISGKPLTQNEYNATIRSEWCDFLDMLHKDNLISNELFNNTTL